MDRTRSNAALFLSVVLLALAVKVFVLDVLYVSGPSMLPTLRPGSFVVHWKLAYGIPIPLKNKYLVRWSSPTEGDVIIYPWLGRHVIKRCRAVAGEPLEYSDAAGYRVRVAGRDIELTEEQYRKMSGTPAVPGGTVFAVGDNPAASRDSRDYGFVSVDSVRGKVLWK